MYNDELEKILILLMDQCLMKKYIILIELSTNLVYNLFERKIVR